MYTLSFSRPFRKALLKSSRCRVHPRVTVRLRTTLIETLVTGQYVSRRNSLQDFIEFYVLKLVDSKYSSLIVINKLLLI